MCEKSAKNGVSNINQTLFNKEVIDKMFTVKRRIIYFTKYKQDLFVRNSVASNKNLFFFIFFLLCCVLRCRICSVLLH